MTLRSTILCTILVLFSQIVFSQTNFYVTANGSGSGSSWNDAISLQSVLSTIKSNGGGTVYNLYMKEGVYNSTSSTFSGDKLINFIGGYNATLTGTNLCSRDPLAYKTQLNFSGRDFRVYRNNSTDLTFDGIYYSNTSNKGYGGDGTFLTLETGVTSDIIFRDSYINGYASKDAGFVYFYNNNGSTFTMENTYVVDGEAGDSGDAGSFVNFFKGSNNSISINNSSFKNNTLSGGGDAVSLIVINDGNNNKLNVDNSAFCTNVNNSNNSKGVVFYVDNVTTKITNSTFFNNQAYDGGVLWVKGPISNTLVRNSQFSQNVAINSGGAIHLESGSGSTTITDNYFDRNSAQGTTLGSWLIAVYHYTYHGGGAIYYRADNNGADGDHIKINGTNKFYANTATNGNGGAILFQTRIFNTIEIYGGLFENNASSEEGGAISIVDRGTTSANTPYAEVEIIQGNSFYGNTTKGGQANIYGADIDLMEREDANALPRVYTNVDVLNGNKLQLPVINGAPIWTNGPGNIPANNYYLPYQESWGIEGYTSVTNNTQQTSPLGLQPLSLSCPEVNLPKKECPVNTTIANDDVNATNSTTPVGGNVLTNDVDPEGDNQSVQSASYTAADGSTANLPLGVSTSIYDANGDLAGEIVLNLDGSYTFTPNENYSGSVPVEYIVVDDNGNPATDAATLTIMVNNVNAEDDFNQGEAGETLTGNLFGNDSDPEGDTFIITQIDTNGDGILDTNPVAGVSISITSIDGTVIGQITINSTTGEYTWVPEDDYEGTVFVKYEIRDNNSNPATDNAVLVIVHTPKERPLPVEFVEFTATVDQVDAKLTWITASEINNSHYEIERSVDGVTFDKIDEVEGAGTTSDFTAYEFMDYGVGTTYAGVYYRLKQVDYDTNAEYSVIVFVAFDDKNLTLTFYPNPVVESLNIEYHGARSIQSMIYNITGKLVGQSNDRLIDFTQHDAGIYLIKVFDLNTDKVLANKKVIVSK